MTQEEKVRAYDEALKKARFYHGNCPSEPERKKLEGMFPVLRESEDERIRRALLTLVRENEHNYRSFCGVLLSEMAAYLEKQKDASKAIEAVDRIDKYIDENVANAHDMKDSNPDKQYYRGWDEALGEMAGILQDVYSNEKQKPNFDTHWENGSMVCEQKEQKHILKFKVGDKVHLEGDDVNILTITGIEEDRYLTDNSYGPILFGAEDIWEIVEQKPIPLMNGDAELYFDSWFQQRGQVTSRQCFEEGIKYIQRLQQEQKIDINKLRKDLYQSGYNDGYQHGKEDGQKEQKPVEYPAGFYVTFPDGKKYYTKEMRCNNMNIKVVEPKPVEWSEKQIADVFEKVGLAKIVRELGDDNLTNALQSAMIELASVKPVEWNEPKINGNPISTENKVVDISPVEWSEEDKKLIDDVINSLCCYQNTLLDYQKEIVGEEIRKLKSLRLHKLDASNLNNFDPVDVLNRIKTEWPMAWEKVVGKQEWSEEDKKHLNCAINICINDFGEDSETATFLKSLPKRFSPQPKQEWSEDFDKEVENVHKRYPEVSFAKLTRIAYHFSKWANRHNNIKWSEKDEAMLNAICCEVVDEGMNPTPQQAAWLKSLPERFNLQPKKEWSEEDEKMLLSIINAFRNGTVSTIRQEQWLKSLPGRFNLEPKEEWRHYIWATNLRFDFTALIKYDNTDNYEIVQAGNRPKQEKNGVYILIKDIKSQSHWKPSEEQMEALNALNLHGDLSYVGQQNQLISLYQDLKKLI